MNVKRIKLLFPVGIAMFAIAGLLIYITLNMMIDKNRHRQEILDFHTELEDLRINFRKAIIEQRDYLLTGKRMYLMRYYASRATAMEDIQTLKSVNPEVFPRVNEDDDVFGLISAHFLMMDSAILYHMRGDQASKTAAIEKTNDDYSYVAGRVEGMEREVARQIDNSMKSINSLAANIEGMVVAIYMFGFVLLFLNYYFLRKEIRVRAAAEEKVQRQAKKLRDLNLTKDKFFSIIAHDLRSPLSHLLGFSALLKNRISANDFPELEKVSQAVHQSTKNTLNLLENLLQWAQLQTGSFEVCREKFDLFEIAEETKTLYSEHASKKGVRLHNEVMTGTWSYSDKNIARTALRNFVTNAIKYSFPDGEIFIQVERQGNAWRLKVKDTGTGMTPDVTEKLFRIDKKQSVKGTANEGGAGFGLALCRELIEQNGGQVGVVSKYNQGSEFYFTVPVMKGPVQMEVEL